MIRDRSKSIVVCSVALLIGTLFACTTTVPEISEPPPEQPSIPTPPSQKPDITKNAIEAAAKAAGRSRGKGQTALWQFADADTTVFVFGTVPVANPEAEWRSSAFNDAFEEADTLVFEFDSLSAAAEATSQRIINEKGLFRDGTLLSDVLTEPVRLRLRSAAARLEIPYAALESFKPWLVARQMHRTAIANSGLAPGSAIEAELTDESQARRKSIEYLTGLDTELGQISDLPFKAQIDRVTVAMIATELNTNLQTAILREWLDGDIKGLTAFTANPAFHVAPSTYKKLITDRNRAYAQQLKSLLGAPGGKLVVLNTEHLLGSNGVIALLQADGISVSGP